MIFNEERFLRFHKQGVIRVRPNDFLKYAADDIIERVSALDIKTKLILCLNDATHSLKKSFLTKYNLDRAEEIFEMKIQEISSICGDNKCDLITSSMSLHFINDIQDFLKNIGNLLSDKGILIANFIGGSSLKCLRKKLIEIEELCDKQHSPHIPPFIKFNDVPPLLSYAGFKEVIVDYEKIQLEYKSPLALMQDIKAKGQSNCLIAAHLYGISKQMYKILANKDKIFEDEITLISFIAAKNKNTIKIKNS